MISRRLFASGLFASAASTALASAPMRSLRPIERPGDLLSQRVPSVESLIERFGLTGRVGFSVADAVTGEILEVHNPLYQMPPASVLKAVTCAYALEHIGPTFRFRTRVLSDGILSDGKLDGDLWLVGSGDPLFDTDALESLADQLAQNGIRDVTGRLRIVSNALPEIRQIDDTQLPHAGYNPAISSNNLNFNRVHFEWVRQGDRYAISMDARSDTVRPTVRVARMEVADRELPIYTYRDADTHDAWTVAREALGNAGSRWLPVRRPSAYVAEVFIDLMNRHGIEIGEPLFETIAPDHALVFAEHVSAPLDDVLRGMMRWSTNLTAEVAGLMATRASGINAPDLPSSAATMAQWMQTTLGARNVRFVDHSGLGVESRIRPQDMTHALVLTRADGRLRDLMRRIPMRNSNGDVIPDHPISVVAKTGTLNFVSGLAGYATPPSGRELAFSIFCADLDRRAAIAGSVEERPAGTITYNRSAKALQQALIERWSSLYR